MSTVASILVIFSSFAAAILVVTRENKHCAMLENADNFIVQIKNRAIFYAEPLSDIITHLSDSDNRIISSFCSFFITFSDLPESTIPKIWNNAVDKVYGKNLEPYECDIIKHFGENMCNCSKDEINRIFESAHEALIEFIATAKEKRNTRTKSSAAISVSVGIMIVLMLF